MLGRAAAGVRVCRELLRPGNLLRGIFIIHFLPLWLGCEAVAAALCVILSWMQLGSRSGAGEVMLGDTISHGGCHHQEKTTGSCQAKGLERKPWKLWWFCTCCPALQAPEKCWGRQAQLPGQSSLRSMAFPIIPKPL